ncbi:hypothetical protein B0920_03650 [Massilia sp. KIM]|uniref:hypothetical protein n=1 Tax=Massilia sp. KIM TaxID=1955422 RepID=UPI00098FB71D|nr:hypothetical protein [Massilia sp. KIM]OON62551.1 hypothetical protein B0920_03650 [Massilia sp. KIM]
MGENKGHQQKGRNYDELSGVGTSSAGITGTTGNLNDKGRDGGVGMPPASDAGNRQSVEREQNGDLPALGDGGRGPARQRQGAQGDSQQQEQDPQLQGQAGDTTGLQKGNT